jgi:hypothetical protein
MSILAAVGSLTACVAMPSRPDTPAEWQALARIELDAARSIIVDAHPGMIDAENPRFGDWVEAGHREALALVPRVERYDDLLAVVRWYTTGFQDGHLSYSDDTRRNSDAMVAHGWAIAEQEGQLRVVDVHPDWPVPLPVVGSEFEGCDGRDAETLLREDIAPFADRRPVEGRASVLSAAETLRLPGKAWRVCQFTAPDGTLHTLPQKYQAIPTPRMFEFFRRRMTVRDGDGPANRFERIGDVLWIRAANFQPQPGSPRMAELEAMLAALPTVRDAEAIVFDVRGNGGGDSSIGDRIFDAATGGLDFDQSNLDSLPRYFAQWRVSDVMLETVRGWVARNEARDGPDAPSTREARAFLAKAEAARAAGADWIEQDAGRTLTRESVAARGGRLRRFEGPIYVLTDESCASACLDFVDLVRLVPGSVHLGRTTSSDRVYIDMGRTKLPSGNHLWLPLKVWRNRWRGDAEPWVPDIPLNVNFDDDAAVRVAVMEAIGLGREE